MSDLRDKDDIVKELETLEGPPPLDPRVSLQANLDALTPPERAFFYKRMGAEDVAQQILAENPQTAQELKSSTELAKTALQEHHETNRQAMKHVVEIKTGKTKENKTHGKAA
jgi:hypothetical protein